MLNEPSPTIKCPDCGRLVSREATSCPGCGKPGPRFPKPPSDDDLPNRRVCTSCARFEKVAPEETGLPCAGCKKTGFFVAPARFKELYPNRVIQRGPSGVVLTKPHDGFYAPTVNRSAAGGINWGVVGLLGLLSFIFPFLLLGVVIYVAVAAATANKAR